MKNSILVVLGLLISIAGLEAKADYKNGVWYHCFDNGKGKLARISYTNDRAIVIWNVEATGLNERGLETGFLNNKIENSSVTEFNTILAGASDSQFEGSVKIDILLKTISFKSRYVRAPTSYNIKSCIKTETVNYSYGL